MGAIIFIQVVKDILIPLLVCQATPQAAQALEFVATNCEVVWNCNLVVHCEKKVNTGEICAV